MTEVKYVFFKSLAEISMRLTDWCIRGMKRANEKLRREYAERKEPGV